jgi:hypothetical protein
MESTSTKISNKKLPNDLDCRGNFVPMSNKIANWVFFIPFTYIYVVRLGTIAKFLSILIIYGVPTFYLFILHTGVHSSSLLTYFISFLLIHGLYETGYLQNDTETIKNETKPALRLYEYNYDYYEKHKHFIYGIRISWCLILSFAIFLLNGFTIYSYSFLTSTWAIILIYQIYNRVRSNWTLFWLFFLIMLRCFSYVFLFINIVHIPHIIALFLSYPLLKYIEMATRPRHNIKFLLKIFPNKQSLPINRLYYGLLMLVVSFLLMLVGFFSFLDCIFFLYFFFYRFLIYFTTHRNKIQFKNYLNE